MKYSRQRELIRNAVIQNPIHPTADDVYSLVKQQEPNISLGTVYRNLNLLADQGELIRIRVPDGSDHYDARTEQHHHLLCEQCGRMFDIELGSMTELEKKLDQLSPFTVTGYDIFVKGLCSHCAK